MTPEIVDSINKGLENILRLLLGSAVALIVYYLLGGFILSIISVALLIFLVFDFIWRLKQRTIFFIIGVEVCAVLIMLFLLH